MKKYETSVRITLFANRLVAAILAVLIFTLPLVLDWYCHYRPLTELERTALTVAFYVCSVVVGIALWNMDSLLRAIAREEVFTEGNGRRIRAIGWCCGATALSCVPAAFCYYPLVFMVIVMAFLFLAVNVLCRVMDAAVAIREENDLTV